MQEEGKVVETGGELGGIMHTVMYFLSSLGNYETLMPCPPTPDFRFKHGYVKCSLSPRPFI